MLAGDYKPDGTQHDEPLVTEIEQVYTRPPAWGFDYPRQYAEVGFGYPWKTRRQMLTFPRLIVTRFFHTKTIEEMQEATTSGGAPLKKTLGSFGLTMLGVGFMIGAGIFVSPGYIAHSLTGPALFISYIVAAASAFLSSFCYAEFTVDLPFAGAAFNYISVSLGEWIAWVTVANLILEYILSNAAAARGFSPYLALLVNKPVDYFTLYHKGYTFDFWACGLTLVVTGLLTFGLNESTKVNSIITLCHLGVMVFIIIAGLTKAKAANFSPLLGGHNWRNIFNGAAVSFFSYIGFDALATTAEEQIDPAKSMPIGILGSVSVVTVVYVLMSVTLCLMVPSPDISEAAAFSAAFEYVGMNWAKYIVSIGALFGICTTTLIGVLGVSRIVVGCTREYMIPPFCAWVGPRGTPWVATWIVGIISAVVALITDFAELANMISIGTFIVFWVVAVGLIWRRSYNQHTSTRREFYIALFNLFNVIGWALGFTLVWVLPQYQPLTDYEPEGAQYHQQPWWLIAMACVYICACIGLKVFVKEAYTPRKFKVPFYPLIPCGSIFLNLFLLGQLDEASYKRFGYWSLVAIMFYFFYGMIAGQNKDNHRMARMTLPTTTPGDENSGHMPSLKALNTAVEMGLAKEGQPSEVEDVVTPSVVHNDRSTPTGAGGTFARRSHDVSVHETNKQH